LVKRQELIVGEGERKLRLEDFLFARFPGLSRMYLRGVVRDEKCEVNGRLENVGYRLRVGDFLEIELDLDRENSMRPENIPLDIVYEDEHLIVINKPAGMLVHPTNRDKNGTLLNALVYHLNADRLSGAEFQSGVTTSGNRDETGDSDEFRVSSLKSEVIRPGLVHRLDRQTSGLIVIAKSVRVHRSLAAQFQKKYVEKKYLALVEGTVELDSGMINATIGRFAERKQWDVKQGGKIAETRFKVLERRSDTTLLELEPVTGRTNQLRIHCASIGHPIVGEVTRGGREYERLCLHAWKLEFRHPVTREDMAFASEVEW
jgi:23S rRNA pseudouridine1911/1915/1917 synthase